MSFFIAENVLGTVLGHSIKKEVPLFQVLDKVRELLSMAGELSFCIL